mgnify:CR=1 FL=1
MQRLGNQSVEMSEKWQTGNIDIQDSIEHDSTAQWRSKTAFLNAKAFEKLCSRQDGVW